MNPDQPNVIKGEALLNHPSRILITGKSGWGKTTLGVYLINNRFRFSCQRFIFIVPSYWSQDVFRDVDDLIKHKTDVITDPTAETFKELVNDLLRVKDVCREKGLPPINTCVFVDDLAGLPVVHGGRISSFAHFAHQARPLGCTCIVLGQQAMAISPAYRDNVTAVMSFPVTKKSEIKWLIEEYCGPDISDKQMKQIISAGWRGYVEREDGVLIPDPEGWGKHFLFILCDVRKNLEYYIDFDYSITPKPNVK